MILEMFILNLLWHQLCKVTPGEICYHLRIILPYPSTPRRFSSSPSASFHRSRSTAVATTSTVSRAGPIQLIRPSRVWRPLDRRPGHLRVTILRRRPPRDDDDDGHVGQLTTPRRADGVQCGDPTTGGRGGGRQSPRRTGGSSSRRVVPGHRTAEVRVRGGVLDPPTGLWTEADP